MPFQPFPTGTALLEEPDGQRDVPTILSPSRHAPQQLRELQRSRAKAAGPAHAPPRTPRVAASASCCKEAARRARPAEERAWRSGSGEHKWVKPKLAAGKPCLLLFTAAPRRSAAALSRLCPPRAPRSLPAGGTGSRQQREEGGKEPKGKEKKKRVIKTQEKKKKRKEK